MTGAHLHLLVNHAPLFGALFALVLLAASLAWPSDALRRTALVVLVATGVAAAAANFSGEPAEDAIRGFPGVRRALIHDHEELGEKAFIAAALAGVVALVLLVRQRRVPVTRGATLTGLALSVVVAGMMAWTALLGGRIRHTEVRPDATAADAGVVEPPRERPGAPGGEGGEEER